MNQDQASQRPPGRPSQGAVAFLQALIAAEPDGLRAWLAAHRLDVDAVAWLHAQGLAPYAFHRLREEVGLVESVAPAARDELRQAYYRSSADAAIHDGELRQVLGALFAASIVPVLFKGAALAHTAYTSSACRPGRCRSHNPEQFVRETFASNWIAPLGPQVDAFEQEFAAAVGAPAMPLKSA